MKKKKSNSFRQFINAAFIGIPLIASTFSCNDEVKATVVNAADSTKNIEMHNSTTAPTQYASIGGKKIAYRSIGKGEPMILCLRYRGNLDSWDPAFLDALSKYYNVITFDYSGFGSSTGTPATNMLAFANDIKELAAALNIKNAS